MKKFLGFVICAVTAVIALSGCAKAAAKDADLSKVMVNMKEKITNTQMTDLTSDDLMPNYGIKSDDVKQFAAYVDSTGTKGDEIILVQGNSSEAAGRIKEKLDDRYHQKETEMKNYLPKEYGVLKQCRVEQNENYISMIVSPQYEDLEKIYQNAFK